VYKVEVLDIDANWYTGIAQKRIENEKKQKLVCIFSPS